MEGLVEGPYEGFIFTKGISLFFSICSEKNISLGKTKLETRNPSPFSSNFQEQKYLKHTHTHQKKKTDK